MQTGTPNKTAPSRRRGSALVAVLWCLVILSVIAYGVLTTSQLELRLAKNYGDSLQAHYLAIAGIETAKALMYEESQDRKTEGENYRSTLDDDPSKFREITLGRGTFSIMRGAREDERPRRVVYGIRGEEARLNVNTVSKKELMQLPGMTSDVVAAILDWRDKDDKLTPEGAEMEYYYSLPDPYRMRNGPLESLRELLSVRGIEEDLLLEEDANLNGILDPSENDGRESYPFDNRDNTLDGGWSQWLTVHSGTTDTDASSEDRINISLATEEMLTDLEDVSFELAKAIVAYREGNSFDNIGQLLDVTPVEEKKKDDNQSQNTQNQTANQTKSSPTRAPSPPKNSGGGGEKLISEAHFKRIADKVTVSSGLVRRGVVNVSTAPLEVLMCLPEIDEERAGAIISYRQQIGGFTSIGQLLDVPGITSEIFKKVCNRLTVRPGTYRILAEGFLPSTGARKKIEAVVRMTSFRFETLYYREES